MQINRCNPSHKQTQLQKTRDYLNRCRKGIGQNLTSFHTKNSQQTRYWWNVSQSNKNYLWQTHSQYNTEWAKTGSIPFENQHKKRTPSLTTPVQHSIGSSSQSNQARKRNIGHSIRKGGSQIVSICRWHDCIFRRPHHLSPKTPETDKQLQQSQDTKSMCRNHKHSYTPITDLKRAKSRMKSHLQLLQRE